MEKQGVRSDVSFADCIAMPEPEAVPDGTDAAAKICRCHALPDLSPDRETRMPMRYMGKPVYARLVECDRLPNQGVKVVPHRIPAVEWVQIHFSYSRVIGPTYCFPVNFTSTEPGGGLEVMCNDTVIRFRTAANHSALSAVICLLYTKTTDVSEQA